jgi:hypothetical protein
MNVFFSLVVRQYYVCILYAIFYYMLSCFLASMVTNFSTYDVEKTFHSYDVEKTYSILFFCVG